MRIVPGIKSILLAAWIASATLLIVESLLTAIFTPQSFWSPFWRVAAIFMGTVVLHWPAIFDFSAIAAAWTALFLISIVYVLILAWTILPWSGRHSITVGAVYGIPCYLVNLYIFGARFPWLADERNWRTLLSHLAFGAMSAWVLAKRSRWDCLCSP
jgi:hypothetical protein